MIQKKRCKKCSECSDKEACFENQMEAVSFLVKSVEPPLLNTHGEYVLKFAKNHGISVAEAYVHPMVKAHLEYFQSAAF